MHTKDMYLYVLVVLVSIAEDFADCSSFGISVVLCPIMEWELACIKTLRF